MTTNANTSGSNAASSAGADTSGTGARASRSRDGARKPPLLAQLIGGVFAVAGTVAPRPVSSIARRLIFTPSRLKSYEPARRVLSAANSKTSSVDGERVWQYIWGDQGARVLLVHGWSGGAEHMAPFVEPLRRANCQVIALDLPAHGKSSGRTASVKHFERCIADAAQTYGPFEGVIAHSLGAAAVAYSLSRGLAAQRVAFVSPICNFDSVWKNSARSLNLPARVMPLVVKGAEKWLGTRFAEMDPLQLAPSLSTPLLVVHDRGDRQSPFEDATALVAKWPHAELFAIDGAGHTRALQDPETIERVVSFMTKQGAPPQTA